MRQVVGRAGRRLFLTTRARTLRSLRSAPSFCPTRPRKPSFAMACCTPLSIVSPAFARCQLYRLQGRMTPWRRRGRGLRRTRGLAAGTSSLEHPGVQMIAQERGKYYLGGAAPSLPLRVCPQVLLLRLLQPRLLPSKAFSGLSSAPLCGVAKANGFGWPAQESCMCWSCPSGSTTHARLPRLGLPSPSPRPPVHAPSSDSTGRSQRVPNVGGCSGMRAGVSKRAQRAGGREAASWRHFGNEKHNPSGG